MSGDKNIVTLKVAKIAAFQFYRYKFLSRVEDKNLYRLPIRQESNYFSMQFHQAKGQDGLNR